MRDLTRFEWNTISGGTINTHIVVPAQPLTKEDGFVVMGITCGMAGGMLGVGFAVAKSWSAPAALACGVIGTVAGAFGLPYSFKTIENGLIAGYQKLGILD